MSALLREPAVGHAPRLLVVKALLRLHRKEVDAFQSARIAAEETRLRRAARGDDDDDDKTGSQEIELLAERSPEELEAEKVEQAKRDGNFFNLADSQPVDEDGPTLPSEPADDTTTRTTTRRLDRSWRDTRARSSPRCCARRSTRPRRRSATCCTRR